MAEEPKCPNCNSHSVLKSSAAFDQGRSHYEGNTGGFGISSNGRIGAYRGSHSGERMSSVAAKNSPPSIDGTRFACLLVAGILATPILFFLGILINGFMGLIITFGMAMVAILVFLMMSFSSATSDVQRTANERYSKQWYCNRCGEQFILEFVAVVGAPTDVAETIK